MYRVQPDGSGQASRVQSGSSPGSPSAEDDQTRQHQDRIVPDISISSIILHMLKGDLDYHPSKYVKPESKYEYL